MREIPLTRGYVAQVDDEDFERANQFKWYALPCKYTVYAYRRVGKKYIALHRFLLDAPDGILVDHRDRNGLNCKRKNIRLATHGQNTAYRENRRSKLGLKGVDKMPRGGYRARIKKDGKSYHIGTFKTAREAAEAYNQKAIELHGEFAGLNSLSAFT